MYTLNNPVNLRDPSGEWTVDLNLSIGSGGWGMTTGVLFSEEGIYSYSGAGVAQPGPGIGLFYSPDDPTTGTSVQMGGGYIVGGSASHDYSNDNNSYQVGLTTPGYGAYTIVTNPLVCF